MKIYYRDGGRFLTKGGYQVFSQGLLYGFIGLGVEIHLPKNTYIEAITKYGENSIPIKEFQKNLNYDYAITITNINEIPEPKEKTSNILITGSPYLGLASGLLKKITQYDTIFYSGNVDLINFQSLNSRNLPQPIDTLSINSNLTKLPTEKCEIKERYDYEILFVGTFTYWKGIDLCVKAYCHSRLFISSRLTLKCPLNLTGASPEDSEIIRARHYELYISLILNYTKQIGKEFKYYIQVINSFVTRIVLTCPGVEDKVIELDMHYGSREQMNELYNNTDVLLHLSRGETWSMPVGEALINGIRAIFPKHYGISEYVSDIPNSTILESKQMYFDDFDFTKDRSSGGGRIYTGCGIRYFEIDIHEASSAIEKNAIANKFNSEMSRVIVQDRLSTLCVARKYHDALFA